MAETSYFWGGTLTGDKGPYTSEQFAIFFRSLFQYDRTLQGPILDASNKLACTNPSGTTIRIASGNAMVSGTLYTSSANTDFTISAPATGTRYYTIILRKDFSAQTVRLVLNGPSTSAYPTVVQSDGSTWEINIWKVTITSAGVITITDARVYCVHNSAVNTAMLLDANVTSIKIADGAITTTKIADANVTTEKIADNAITTAKIAAGAVGNTDLATGSVTSTKLADSSVTTTKIADAAVTTDQLGTGAVTSVKILNGAVLYNNLATDAVITAKIKDVNVTTGKIADNAITSVKIADLNVTTGKINDLAVTAAKIANATITLAKMAANVFPRVVYRQGGSGGDWSVQGFNNYAVTTQPIIQVGVGVITLTHQSTTITFPTSFSSPPVILISPVNDGPVDLEIAGGYSETTFIVQTSWTITADCPFQWMAIGPA